MTWISASSDDYGFNLHSIWTILLHLWGYDLSVEWAKLDLKVGVGIWIWAELKLTLKQVWFGLV